MENVGKAEMAKILIKYGNRKDRNDGKPELLLNYTEIGSDGVLEYCTRTRVQLF